MPYRGVSAGRRAWRALPGFGRDRDIRILVLGAAAGADRVVDLRHASAAGTCAAELVALEAEGDRGEQSEEGHDPRDEEPEEERAALDLADEPTGEAEAHGAAPAGAPTSGRTRGR